jgi:Na+:H+ antiporter
MLALLAAAPVATAPPAPSGSYGGLLPLLEALVLVLVGARVGGALMARIGLPRVLGELGAGILLGNLGLLGWHRFDAVAHQPTLVTLGEIGVLFLLFDVGLHSDLAQLMAVGRSAVLVAALGVGASLGLGTALSRLAFPAQPWLSHVFLGATVCATSIGITARALADLGRLTSLEGRVILGAAVVDDVLGLVVLAVLTDGIAAGRFAPLGAAIVLAKAAAFLGAALLGGGWLARHLFRFAASFPAEGLLLTVALVFCFGLAWLAGIVGLAPMVGAFAAGLVLDEVHYRPLQARAGDGRDVPALLAPLSTLFVPVFFVLLGMRVDLRAFAAPGTLGFAVALTVAAVASKQACALGVLERGADRVVVALGMVPRGEVVVIFASIGSALLVGGAPVLNAAQFSAVVLMVAATTLITPPLLAWRLRGRAG